MTTCDRCAALIEALERATARNTELETELARVQAQLAELDKLCELQQADLKRHEQAMAAAQPNHPERAPQEQLQLAFERLLETLEVPANDNVREEATANPPASTPSEAAKPAGQPRGHKQKRRHPHGRRRLDLTTLPVDEIVIDPPEVLATGGVGFELVGPPEISERIALRAAHYRRVRVVRNKYIRLTATTATEFDSNDPERPVIIAPLPENLWPNFMADTSVIADVIVSKYEDCLPLNRQQTISARDRFVLPKSTQAGWLKAAHAFCAPVVEAMWREARERAFVIATDATGAPVLPVRVTEPQAVSAPRRQCDPWHVFVFIADQDHVVFQYSKEHTGAAFAKFLDGYHGHLLADAASVYDVLYREHEMTESGCWFHCRRPFYRALASDAPRAYEALALIGKLFEVERDLRAQRLDLDTFTRLRRERATPLLALVDRWIEHHLPQVEERSPIRTAMGYYQNQREALRRFLDDGRIRLDNNLSEQNLRKLIVGLSNWVFFANQTGLAWYTTFRSLIASCALHQLNPAVYLEQLLRIAPHWPRKRVLELAPKYWRDTVTKLEPRWLAMLERPWEPGVLADFELGLIRAPDPGQITPTSTAPLECTTAA